MEKFKPVKPVNKNEKIIITIRLEDYRVEELDKIANRINISRNELISQCLDFAVKNLSFDSDNNDKRKK